MRDGVHLSTDVMPGNAYKITLSDMVTGILFPTGHRIRLDISSSDFPNDDRNQIITDESSWVVAKNSIHHGAQYSSHVVLSVLAELCTAMADERYAGLSAPLSHAGAAARP
jgi:predicted acyl esterase